MLYTAAQHITIKMDQTFRNMALRTLCPDMKFHMDRENNVVPQPGDVMPADDVWNAEIVNAKNKWALQEIRNKRNILLTASDKYMIVDFPITSDQRAAWSAYRQALRVLPDNLANQQLEPFRIDQYFPTPPS